MQHWDDLRFLLALDEHGSLIKAAKHLKTNPTTVSRHIKRLSEAYKRTLVKRQPNGEWSLTEDGAVFALIAKRCSDEIRALDGQDQTASKAITITTTEFIGEHILAPQVGNTISAQDDLTLTLDMQDVNVSLAYGDADLAIRLGRPTSGKLISSKLADLEMNIFSNGGKMTQRWVGLPAQFDWVPEMQLGLDFFGCPPVFRVGSYASIREIASRHDLACIGPKFMMEGWHELRQLDHLSPSASREVWSVFHESRKHDESLRKARRWAKECFELLPELVNELMSSKAKV